MTRYIAQTAKPSSLDDAKAKLLRTLHEEPEREDIKIKTNEAITLNEAKQHLKATLSGQPVDSEIKLDSAGTDWQECSDAVVEKIKQEQLLAARKKLRKTLSSEASNDI